MCTLPLVEKAAFEAFPRGVGACSCVLFGKLFGKSELGQTMARRLLRQRRHVWSKAYINVFPFDATLGVCTLPLVEKASFEAFPRDVGACSCVLFGKLFGKSVLGQTMARRLLRQRRHVWSTAYINVGTPYPNTMSVFCSRFFFVLRLGHGIVHLVALLFLESVFFGRV